jgi:uncharacterized protein (DUF362 family)
MDPVALVRYNDKIGETIEKGIGLLGGWRKPKSPFIVKPNIAALVTKSKFAVTDVKVVEAVVKLALKQDRNLSVKIAESDSDCKYADEAFRKFGYTRIEKRFQALGFDVSLINLSHRARISTKLDGLYFKNPELPDVIAGSKYLISIAVAKTHPLTFVTGSMKNLFGLLPRKDKVFYHPHINDVIVDLNRLVRTDLCIVDARTGVEGWEGPITRRLGMFILGTKPASVDATMARIMGFKPEKIRHLVEAEKFGLGTLDPLVVGENLESATVKFRSPSNLSPKALVK